MVIQKVTLSIPSNSTPWAEAETGRVNFISLRKCHNTKSIKTTKKTTIRTALTLFQLKRRTPRVFIEAEKVLSPARTTQASAIKAIINLGPSPNPSVGAAWARAGSVRRPKSRVRKPAKAVIRPHLIRTGMALRFMKNKFRVADNGSKIGPVCFKNAILPPL